MSTPSESGSSVAARLDERSSSDSGALPPSEAEQPLLAEMRSLVQQLAETNVHLLVLTDQVAKCLAHISLLLDLILSNEEEVDETDGRKYLDGTPVL